MSSKFNVVFTGLQEGVTEDEFVTRFCQKFGISEEKARRISASAAEVTIKKDLSEEKARKYISAMEACGVIARLDEVAEIPEPGSGLSMAPMEGVSPEENAEPSPTSSGAVCPKCGSDQVVGDECQACGIFISKYLASQQGNTLSDNSISHSSVSHGSVSHGSVGHSSINQSAAPMASRAEAQAGGAENPYATPESDLTDSDEILEPERVAIGSGIQWLSGGFWHFKQNPFAWIAAFVVFFVLFMILALIPFIGGIMTNLLSPVIMAGFALGANEQQEGGDFTVGHLFAGFSNNVGQLMLVGVFYFLGIIAIGIVAALLMGGSLASGMMTQGMDPNAMVAMMEPGMLIMMLIIFVVVILLTMAYYYAPLLIVFEGMNAWSAMGMSFRGCLKNWLAFIIYFILVIVLFVIASIPFLLGLLIAVPMIQAAIYVSYRDIFHHQY